MLPTKAGGTDADVDLLYPVKRTEFVTEEPDINKFKVAIVGAGAAGLFTAMIFDHLKDQFGLDVEYEIIESRDRWVSFIVRCSMRAYKKIELAADCSPILLTMSRNPTPKIPICQKLCITMWAPCDFQILRS